MEYNKFLENKQQKCGIKLDVNANRISAVAYFSEIKPQAVQIFDVNGLRIFVRILSKVQYEDSFKEGQGKIVFPYYYFSDQYFALMKNISIEYHKNGIHAEISISKDNFFKIMSEKE